MREFIFFIIFTFVFFAIFFTISYDLYYRHNYIHSDLLYFGEKALLAKEGNPPRVENIGLVYPPLGFLPFLLYNDVIITPTFVSALLSSLLFIFFINICENCIINFVILIILINPLYLFLATQKYELLAFFITIALSVGNLLLYYKYKYTIYAFLAGILTGLSFMLDFRSIFLIPLYLLGILLDKVYIKEVDNKLGICLVVITPIVCCVLGWMYLNFIFKGEALFFLYEKESLLGSFDEHSNFLEFLWLIRSVKFFYEKVWIILPYLLLLFVVIKNDCNYACNTILYFYLAPVWLLFIYNYFGYKVNSFYFTVLFMLIAIIYAKIYLNSIIKYFDTILVFVFVVSFVFSYKIGINSEELNEKNFVRFMLGKEVEMELRFTYAKEMANVINTYEAKNILCDDRTCYKVVYFARNAKRFILPYSYEFETYLSNPHLFADYVLVNMKNSKDLIVNRFPIIKNGFLSKFYKVFENEEYALFKRENQN